MTPEVVIYTDGACSGNPGPGGWGAILISGEHRKELSGLAGIALPPAKKAMRESGLRDTVVSGKIRDTQNPKTRPVIAGV